LRHVLGGRDAFVLGAMKGIPARVISTALGAKEFGDLVARIHGDINEAFGQGEGPPGPGRADGSVGSRELQSRQDSINNETAFAIFSGARNPDFSNIFIFNSTNNGLISLDDLFEQINE